MNINHNYTWFTHRPTRFRRQRKKKEKPFQNIKMKHFSKSKLSPFIEICFWNYKYIYFPWRFLSSVFRFDIFVNLCHLHYVWADREYPKRVVILPAVSFLLPLRFKSAVDFAFCLNQALINIKKVEFYTKNIAQKFEEDVGGCAMLNNSCMIILCIFMHRLQLKLAISFWNFWIFWKNQCSFGKKFGFKILGP